MLALAATLRGLGRLDEETSLQKDAVDARIGFLGAHSHDTTTAMV